MLVTWFSICAFLFLLEVVTVNLVSIWFAIGAFFAMIASLITDSLVIQIIVFSIISIIALLITKPLVKKMHSGKIQPTNSDRVIGKRATVTKKITEDEYGEVKVLGTTWTAVSDKKFDVGEKVVVKKIDGVKLIVEREEK